MLRPIQQKSNSWRLLLYLEWILLAMAAVFIFLPEHANEARQLPLLTIFVTTGFAVMGLILPPALPIAKVLYTGLEFGLLLLPIFLERGWLHFFELLCLVMLIRSCQMFRPPGPLLLAGLAYTIFMITLFFRVKKNIKPLEWPIVPDQIARTVLNLRLNTALSFGLALVFLLLFLNALIAERQRRDQLTMANAQLRWYAQRIEDQAKLQERNRIAREIHDTLGHSLSAQSIQLENALILWQSDAKKAQAFLIDAKRLGSKALQEVLQSVAEIRCDPLQGQHLEAAIGALVQEFHRTSGIMPECTISLSFPLPAEVGTASYRIVQEALTNIYKHAVATKITIQLQTTAQNLHLLVEDNGRGFNLEQNTTGFGLQGMRERAEALGGRFNIISSPQTGCRIVAHIALPSVLHNRNMNERF